MKIKYFTKSLLIAANDQAILTNRNRTLIPEKLTELPDDIKLPVIFTMIHNDIEVRLAIVMNSDGMVAYLDVPFETEAGLPVYEIGAV